MSSLSFHLSRNIFNSTSFLKYYFAGYRHLSWFFFLSAFWICHPIFYIPIVSDEKSAFNLIENPLYIMNHFFSWHFFSLLFFWNIWYFDMLDGVHGCLKVFIFLILLSVPQIRQFQLNYLQVFWCFRLTFHISYWAALVNFLFQWLQFSNSIFFFTISLYWYSFLVETLFPYLVLTL